MRSCLICPRLESLKCVIGTGHVKDHAGLYGKINLLEIDIGVNNKLSESFQVY